MKKQIRVILEPYIILTLYVLITRIYVNKIPFYFTLNLVIIYTSIESRASITLFSYLLEQLEIWWANYFFPNQINYEIVHSSRYGFSTNANTYIIL